MTCTTVSEVVLESSESHVEVPLSSGKPQSRGDSNMKFHRSTVGMSNDGHEEAVGMVATFANYVALSIYLAITFSLWLSGCHGLCSALYVCPGEVTPPPSMRQPATKVPGRGDWHATRSRALVTHHCVTNHYVAYMYVCLTCQESLYHIQLPYVQLRKDSFMTAHSHAQKAIQHLSFSRCRHPKSYRLAEQDDARAIAAIERLLRLLCSTGTAHSLQTKSSFSHRTDDSQESSAANIVMKDIEATASTGISILELWLRPQCGLSSPDLSTSDRCLRHVPLTSPSSFSSPGKVR